MSSGPWTAGVRVHRGLWVSCLGPFALEALADQGLDWVGIDLQHGALEVGDLPALLRVTAASGTRCLVRVPSHDHAVIGRVLDHGPDGVIVPAVETGAQAAAVVSAASSPPHGTRSTGLGRAALGVGSPGPPTVLVMVETAAGYRARAEILAVPGVDGVFVGPYDLSLSLGAARTTDEPVVQAIRQVLHDTSAAGLLTGYFAGDRRLVQLLPDVDLLAVDSDVAALRAGVDALLR